MSAGAAVAADGQPPLGALLREWRRRRRLSQLDLALEADVSARHLSFLETGRAKPSREMVLRLADRLELPLREQNRMLLAAGFAPAWEERTIDAPEMAPAREALARLLAAHEPYPAVVVDRGWNVVAANGSLSLFTGLVAPELLQAPVNVLRVTLHPDGMAPRLADYGEIREHLLNRLRRHVEVTGDPELAALYEELSAYPPPLGTAADTPAVHHGLAGEIALPLRLRHPDAGELAFISTVATFGTAIDVTLAELSIEAFFPADAETADYLMRKSALRTRLTA
jgi:transcriptional regulator with XRE-family HTH domain